MHLSHVLRRVIMQLRTSSVRDWDMHEYLWKKEFSNRVIKEWNLKNTTFITVVSFIKWDNMHCLFKQRFGPLRKVMEYADQRCLGLFLLELKRHRENLLKDNSTACQAHPQSTITIFFSPITPNNATSQSRVTQMGSQPRHNRGVTITEQKQCVSM